MGVLFFFYFCPLFSLFFLISLLRKMGVLFFFLFFSSVFFLPLFLFISPFIVSLQRIHMGEKPYECSQSHKRFVQSNDLIRHRWEETGWE